MSGYACGERWEVVESDCCGGCTVYETTSRAVADAVKSQYESEHPDRSYYVSGGTVHTM